jgi:hypothetical protein
MCGSNASFAKGSSGNSKFIIFSFNRGTTGLGFASGSLVYKHKTGTIHSLNILLFYKGILLATTGVF